MKRVNSSLFTVLSAILAVSACQREAAVADTQAPVQGEEMVIPVSVEGAIDCDVTKITVNPTTGVTAWETNEPIGVYVSGPGANAYVKAPVVSNSIRLSLATGQSRANYAIAPWESAPASGYTTPTVIYPATYNMTGKDVTSANNWAPTPMVASNSGTELHFFHVGGLIRLHVTDIPSGTTQLVVTFNGMSNVFGTFSVDNAGTNTATTTYVSDGSNEVTFTNLSISGTEAYLNIPVPTKDFSALTGITVASSGGTELTSTKSFAGWGEIMHGAGKKCTVSFTSISGGNGLFRGWEISKGILKWDASMNSGLGGYTLTSGEDPLELLNYYAVSSSLDVYYHQAIGTTNSLKYRLDGDNNVDDIQNTSIVVDGLYWSIPLSDWGVIIDGYSGAYNLGRNGQSITCPTVNGTTNNVKCFKANVIIDLSDATVANGAAADYRTKGLTTVSKSGNVITSVGSVGDNTVGSTGYQAGLLLIPDGCTITCPSLTELGVTYQKNVLSFSTLKVLLDGGCCFLPAAGSYSGTPTFRLGGTYTMYLAAKNHPDNDNHLILEAFGVTASPKIHTAYYTNSNRYPVKMIR